MQLTQRKVDLKEEMRHSPDEKYLSSWIDLPQEKKTESKKPFKKKKVGKKHHCIHNHSALNHNGNLKPKGTMEAPAFFFLRE